MRVWYMYCLPYCPHTTTLLGAVATPVTCIIIAAWTMHHWVQQQQGLVGAGKGREEESRGMLPPRCKTCHLLILWGGARRWW